MNFRGRELWLESVVPLTVEGVWEKMKSGQFFIGDFDTSGIGVAIFECRDRQALFGGRMREQFKNDLKGGERFGAPVDGNEGEEPMFDLVPFAGCRRIMTHRDAEMFFIGQLL